MLCAFRVSQSFATIFIVADDVAVVVADDGGGILRARILSDGNKT